MGITCFWSKKSCIKGFEAKKTKCHAWGRYTLTDQRSQCEARVITWQLGSVGPPSSAAEASVKHKGTEVSCMFQLDLCRSHRKCMHVCAFSYNLNKTYGSFPWCPLENPKPQAVVGEMCSSSRFMFGATAGGHWWRPLHFTFLKVFQKEFYYPA